MLSKFSATAALLRFFELPDSLEVPYGEDTKYSEMEKQNLNSDKILGMLLLRSMTGADTCFLFLIFFLLWSFVHFFPFHSIRYQLSNWWTTFCHYFSMFQYNLLHLDIFKDQRLSVWLCVVYQMAQFTQGTDCPGCSLHRMWLWREWIQSFGYFNPCFSGRESFRIYNILQMDKF